MILHICIGIAVDKLHYFLPCMEPRIGKRKCTVPRTGPPMNINHPINHQMARMVSNDKIMWSSHQINTKNHYAEGKQQESSQKKDHINLQ